ncbi:MATE family efflux transporter [Serratia grimesii]|uniref:hypothetical protein n=1 Tax=Serratia grimesii TaxID=82995 RepID=UPI0021B77A5D|nr:hypothetical protein [Serratia grimesii]
MSNKKRVLTNSFSLYSRTIILMFVTLYTSRMALDSLGVSDFGLYSLISSVIILFSFVQNVFSLSTQRYLTIEIAKNDNKKTRDTFGCIIMMYFVVCVFVLLLSESFGLWFILTQIKSATVSGLDIFLVYQITIATLLIQIIQTPFMGYILAVEKMSTFAKIGIFDAFQRWLMVFLFTSFYFQNKIIAYSFFLFLGCVLVFSAYIYVCSKDMSIYNLIFSKKCESSVFKEMLLFTRWPLLGAFSVVAVSQSMAFLAYYFVGLIANASMWLAEQVLNAFNRVTGALQMAFTPQIIKNCSVGNIDEIHGMILLSCKVSAFVIILSGVPVFIYADFVTKVWLGDVPPYLSHLIRIAIAYVFIDSLSNPFVTAIYAKGDLKRYQILISIVMFFSVFFMLMSFFMGFSIYLSFSIRILCSLLLLIFRVYWVDSIFPGGKFNSFLLKDFCKLLVIAVIAVFTCFYFKSFLLDGYFSFVLVSMFNFVIVTFFFFCFVLEINDRNYFLKFIKKYS